jgi:DNA-directed RNA polymerase specialized sigma24 family protein
MSTRCFNQTIRLDSLKSRLVSLWQQREFPAFYAAIQSELLPKLSAFLLFSKNLTPEETEDCISDAIQGLVERQNGDESRIRDPEAYLWRSVKNSANDRWRARKRDCALRKALQNDRETAPLPHRPTDSQDCELGEEIDTSEIPEPQARDQDYTNGRGDASYRRAYAARHWSSSK